MPRRAYRRNNQEGLAQGPRLWSSIGWGPHNMSAVRAMMGELPLAKFRIGQVVKHRLFPFRGVIFDVDPVFSNTEEWWQSIPEDIRPSKDQPFYHLLAENEETEYVAYVSEQNLVVDESDSPVRNAQVEELFDRGEDGLYRLKPGTRH